MGEQLKDIFRPTNCKKCGTRYSYKAFGEYECPECGFIEYDEYGKIRKFLDDNGPQPAVAISKATKIPVPVINQYLREGRLEIPDGSEIFISCEICGADIRFGRYCPQCASKLAKDLQSALMPSEIGEVPKMSGKMRFISSEKNNKRK